MEAQYVFAVVFQLDPDHVDVDPDRFEVRMRRPADPPGDDGWLFFRDNFWHGELNAPEHFQSLTTQELGVPVESVEFTAFETDREYLTALRSEIGNQLAEFRANDVDEVIHKYLGSRLEVRDGRQ